MRVSVGNIIQVETPLAILSTRKSATIRIQLRGSVATSDCDN